MINRLTLRTLEPFIGNSKLFDSLYGGWFEISSHSGLEIFKVDTAYKFWIKRFGSNVYKLNGPVVFTQYIEHELFIFSSGSITDDVEARVIRVLDPLNRGSIIESWTNEEFSSKIQFRPDLLFHVFLEESENGKMSIHLQQYIHKEDAMLVVKADIDASGKVTIVQDIPSHLLEYLLSRMDQIQLNVNSRVF